MKKIILMALISGTIFSGAHAVIINVQNNADGQIQIMPAPMAQKALSDVATMNPFSEIIFGAVKGKVGEEIQQGLEASTDINYNKGESGTTEFQFCPRTFKVKKLSGTGAGKEVSFRTPNCKNFKLEISNTPDGLGIVLPKG